MILLFGYGESFSEGNQFKLERVLAVILLV